MENNQTIIWMIDSLGHGGAEQLMPSILKNLNKAGYNIRVCALQVKSGNPIAAELERLDLPVDQLQIPNLRHPYNLFRILRYLQMHRPQILHTQLEFADILGGISAKILRIPVISTLHTLDTIEEPLNTATWRLKLRWFILKKITDLIISVSEKTREHHIQTAKFNPEKIITIYNGVELEKFRKTLNRQNANIRQELNIPTDSKIILTVAVLREPKGIQFMLNSLPEIRKRHPNTHYLIVGEGTHKAHLLNIVKSLGLEKNVTFAGHRNDIPALMHASQLFVLPTLIDALPTVLIEAMAAELPIVASNVGGIPEIIEDRVNGLLVPAGDPKKLTEACLMLLENKKISNELVQAGGQIIRKRFDIKVQVDHLISCYEGLISSYGKR